MTAEEQALALGRAWEATSEPKRQFVLQIVHPDGKVDTFRIGPHTPTMKTEDVHLIHRLWLNITREPGLDKLHHHDIVTEALTRFARDYAGHDRSDILRDLRKTSRDAGRTRPSGEDGKPRAHPIRTQHEDQHTDKGKKEEDQGPPSPPVVGP